MTVNWVRNYSSGTGLVFAHNLLASVPSGGILRRVHYGWRCTATTSTLYSAANILDTQIAVGIVTGYPAASYSVPNPLLSPGNVAPPVERWLRWEVRGFEPITWGNQDDDVVTWRDSGPVEATDDRAPVTAATPNAAALGVYLVWAPSRTDFPGAGYVSVSTWWSVMYTD
jgi:hypothetical protein